MNWYTAFIALFQKLFSRFRRNYSNYLKSTDSKYFIVYGTLKFIVATNRIPFYTNALSAYQRTAPAGLLPADLNAYYLKEIPVYFYTGKNDFLRLADKAMQKKDQYWTANTVQASITNRQLAGSELAKITSNMQFVITPFIANKYQQLYLNFNQAFMDVELNIIRGEEYYKRVEGTLFVQEQLDTTIKSLEIAYNRGVLLLKNPALTPAQKQAVTSGVLFARNSLTEIKNDPDFTVKICTDCAGNAKIGVLLVDDILIGIAIVAIAVVSWHAVDKYAANAALARQTAERLRARQINADRISNALATIQKVVTDNTLTPEQKAGIGAAANKEITNAEGDTGKLTDQQGASSAAKPGFFDRIETLLLIGGGILLLNNITKKA